MCTNSSEPPLTQAHRELQTNWRRGGVPTGDTSAFFATTPACVAGTANPVPHDGSTANSPAKRCEQIATAGGKLSGR